jgi:hypothetical protein
MITHSRCEKSKVGIGGARHCSEKGTRASGAYLLITQIHWHCSVPDKAHHRSFRPWASQTKAELTDLSLHVLMFEYNLLFRL